MRIGAIGGMDYTQPSPYIYNTNQVSAASLNPIERIPDDPAAGKTDFSGLVEEQENENDLELNETRDMASVLEQQFLASARNASRIMPEMQEVYTTGLLRADASEPKEQPVPQEDVKPVQPAEEQDAEKQQVQERDDQNSPYSLWQQMSQGTAA